MNTIFVRLFTVGLLLVPALTLSAPDVSGVWDLEMRWAGGMKSTGGCTFKQDGDMLAGTCGSEDSPLKGQIRGDKLSWKVDVTQDGSTGQMYFDGELNEGG